MLKHDRVEDVKIFDRCGFSWEAIIKILFYRICLHFVFSPIGSVRTLNFN